MRRPLLTMPALGTIAAGPSFASRSLRPALTAFAALDPGIPLQVSQRMSHGSRQTREEHREKLWAHGRPRDEVRGLGLSHHR